MAKTGAFVTIEATRFQRLLRSKGERMMRSKAERVAALARRNSANNGSIPQGIYVGPTEGKTVKVISSNPHTMLVHNGSRPHKIRPRRQGGWLRFEVNGRVVYAREVNHPGYRGNPFLTNALRQAG